MCGIIGIISSRKSKLIYKMLLNGLAQLQNRGYDSAGIGLLDQNNFLVNKFASIDRCLALDKLKDLKNSLDVYLGMGHNRWATHGGRTDINAHPHVSSSGIFMIVHNGIIENYRELKNMLTKSGCNFISQTDTEVIANLLSYYYEQTKDTVSAIKSTINDLHGTYGLVIANKFEPEILYCVRNGSPLLVGYNDDHAFVVSEQNGFCNLVTSYFTLQNDDICVIKRDNNDHLQILTKHTYNTKQIISFDTNLTPSPYKHWTLKEIHDQPTTVLNAINNGGRINLLSEVRLGGLEPRKKALLNTDNLVILGCGTSYFAGLHSLHYFKSLCNFNTVQIFDGADFEISDVPKIGNTTLVLISQSGETKDLHRCVKIAKDNNLLTIGIINIVDSLIAREVDCGIYLNAGKELGVASTKAFCSQIVCLSLLAIWFSQHKNINENKRIKMITDLRNLSNNVHNTIEHIDDKVKQIANRLVNLNINNIFVLGKGKDEAIAKEGSLKIKEISYIHSEGYSASSLKHGPFALLDEHFPVILLNCDEDHNNKIQNCYEEIKSRQAPIIMISTDQNADIIVEKNSTYQSLLGVIPIQLLAYYLSIGRGINPDTPKNLAKVVTVE